MALDENDKLRLQHIELMNCAALTALSEVMLLFAVVFKDGFLKERAEKLQRLSQSCATQREIMPDRQEKLEVELVKPDQQHKAQEKPAEPEGH